MEEVEYESLRQIFSVWSCYPDGSVSLRDFLRLDEPNVRGEGGGHLAMGFVGIWGCCIEVLNDVVYE